MEYGLEPRRSSQVPAAIRNDESKGGRRKTWLLASALIALGGVFWFERAFSHGRHWESERHTSQTWARTIRAAAQNWQETTQTCGCPTVERLVAERQLDPGASHLDSWGHPFELRCADSELYVTSAGPDGVRGTPDDIMIPRLSAPAAATEPRN